MFKQYMLQSFIKQNMLCVSRWAWRGLDLVATNKATLKPIYQQYHQWLLDYDRKAMQEIFEK